MGEGEEGTTLDRRGSVSDRETVCAGTRKPMLRCGGGWGGPLGIGKKEEREGGGGSLGGVLLVGGLAAAGPG